jgi:hypothetical protein
MSTQSVSFHETKPLNAMIQAKKVALVPSNVGGRAEPGVSSTASTMGSEQRASIREWRAAQDVRATGRRMKLDRRLRR